MMTENERKIFLMGGDKSYICILKFEKLIKDN